MPLFQNSSSPRFTLNAGAIIAESMNTLNWITGHAFTREGCFDAPGFDGIYIIYTPVGIPIYVGQGKCWLRCLDHLNEHNITRHGRLLWCQANIGDYPSLKNGAERFLANHYRPLEGDRWPDVVPIRTNLVP